MTKYTRSIEKLTASIKDIFEQPGISIDTKAIVLVLAATMDLEKFIAFITPLDNLAAIRNKLLEISALRYKYGNMYRDYIILCAMKTAQHDISSDELQRFISEVGDKENYPELSQALSLDELETEKNWQAQTDPQSFTATQKLAAIFLLERLGGANNDHMQTITDAYLHCRSQEKPLVAYYAIIYVMADILTAGGLDAKYSLLYSYKLARKALNKFIETPARKSILHSFNAGL